MGMNCSFCWIGFEHGKGRYCDKCRKSCLEIEKRGAIEALDRAIAMLSHYNMPSVAAMQKLRAEIEGEK